MEIKISKELEAFLRSQAVVEGIIEQQHSKILSQMAKELDAEFLDDTMRTLGLVHPTDEVREIQ